jgi:ferritin-like metal-binding protein YciE
MVISESPDSIKLEEFSKLLCDELGDLLHAENMLLKALPKLIAGTSAPALKGLFENHFKLTRSQVKRLEKMFEALDLPAREKKCEGMMGLLVECQHVLTRAKPSLAVDQALISLARKIESFEAIAYESAAVWAGLCGIRSVREMALEAAEEENAMGRALEKLLPGVNASAPARKSKSRVPMEAVAS